MSLDTSIDVLARVAPFNRLSRDGLRLIAFSADQRRLRGGDVLFRKGEPSHAAALVTSGAIALDASGDGAPAAAVALPGTLIGELALLTKTEYPAQAVAREASEVMLISRVLFRRVLQEYPESAALIHRDYAERLAVMSRSLAQVGARLDQAG